MFPDRSITWGIALIKSPRILPYDIIWDLKFESFIIADEPFSKISRTFETYLSVYNNLWGKLTSSLELLIKFDGRFKVTSVAFFIEDFSLLSHELENFTFTVLYLVILY